MLALMMLVSVFPAEVFAAEIKYDVWVNGEQFTSQHLTVSCGSGPGAVSDAIASDAVKAAK